MWTRLETYLVLICMALILAITFGKARAHDWYPWECCSGLDCAPVERVEEREGVLHVTSRKGTAPIPACMQMRRSEDGRMHVCMRPDGQGCMRALCFFGMMGA